VWRVDVGVITDRMKRIRAKEISASVGAMNHVFGLGLGLSRAVLQTGTDSNGGVILASDARAQTQPTTLVHCTMSSLAVINTFISSCHYSLERAAY
jgi:hypothetical protein